MQLLPRTSLQLHPLDSSGFNSTSGASKRRWTVFPNSAEAAELLLCRNRLIEFFFRLSFFRLRLGTLRSTGDGWHSVGESHSTNACALFDCILVLASHRSCMHPLPRQASLSLLSYSTPTPFSLGLRRGLRGGLAPRSHSASFTRRRPHACRTSRGPCDGPATARVPLSITAAAASLLRRLAGRLVAARLPSPIERPLSLSLYAGHRASCATLSRRTLIAFALAAATPPSLPFGSAQAHPVIVQSRLAAPPPHCIPPPTDTDSQVTFPSATLMLDAPVHQRAWPHSSSAPSLAA